MSAGSASPAVPAARIEKVLEEVRSALVEVIGEEYLSDVPITMETSFESDLEIESVEFVAVSEALQDRYPDVDFVEWVSNMEIDDLMGLRVGQLVEFIARCQE